MRNRRTFSLLLPLLLILASTSLTFGALTISLSPAGLNFDGTAGGSNPSAQQVTVSNSGGGTLIIRINYTNGRGWLRANVSGSSAPHTLTLTPAIAGLSAGTYNATVNVSSTGAANSPVSFPVELILGASSQCVVTKLANNASTQCGPYSYSPNTESNGSNTYVGQDVWNPVTGISQTLTVTNPGNWNVVANIPTDPTDAVKSFPNAGQKYNKVVLDNFHNLYSSFAVNYTRTSPLSVDTGFDLWFNNSANEVMIQHDLVNRGGQCGPVLATEQFGGTNGVPVNTWVLCQYGSEIIWQIQAPTSNTAIFGFQSGSVDILNMIRWLENKGYLPTGSTISDFSYGFELCSTGGQNWTLSLSNWSITQN